MCVFAEAGDDFLVDPIQQPYKFGHPFTMLRNYEVPDEFYPMGELEAIEDLQGELNKGRSQQMNHRKRYARKYLATAARSTRRRSPLWSRSATAKSSRQRGCAAERGDHPRAHQKPSTRRCTRRRADDVGHQHGHGHQRVRSVASCPRSVARRPRRRSFRTRERSCRRQAGAHRGSWAAIGRRMLQLAQQYLTEDQAARVIGNNGQPVWFKFTREDIQGEFDFEVEGGSTQPQNDTFRRQSAMQLLNALGPLVQSGVINLPELLRYVLQNGFGIKDASKFLNDPNAGPPPPVGEPPGGHEQGGPQGGPPQPPQPGLAGIRATGRPRVPCRGSRSSWRSSSSARWGLRSADVLFVEQFPSDRQERLQSSVRPLTE
jgi:hypothetical protein